MTGTPLSVNPYSIIAHRLTASQQPMPASSETVRDARSRRGRAAYFFGTRRNPKSSVQLQAENMVRISDLSKDEWEALKRLLDGGTIQQINIQTIRRLITLGALEKKKNGIELSDVAQRLVIERMARISRARYRG